MKGIVLASLLAVSALASADRPARNAFVDYSFYSVGDLIKEVKNDSKVADRYERHFGMTRQQVIDYVAGLHFGRLQETAVYEVYSVPPDGHIKMHFQQLKRGERMLFDASGAPVMMVLCGNPVTLGPQHQPPVETPVGPPAPPIDTPVGSTPPIETEMVLETPPTPAEMTYVPPAEEILPGPVLSSPSPSFSGVGAAGGLLSVVALGGVFVFTNNHTTHVHVTTPVPEPTPIAFFAMGVGGVALLKRSKKRSQ